MAVVSSPSSLEALKNEQLWLKRPQYCDLTFKLQGDKHQPYFIPVHCFIIRARCPTLWNYVQSHRSNQVEEYSGESSASVFGACIEVDEYEWRVFEAMLHYLYVDAVHVPPHRLNHLRILAGEYNLRHLQALCWLQVGFPSDEKVSFIKLSDTLYNLKKKKKRLFRVMAMIWSMHFMTLKLLILCLYYKMELKWKKL